MGIGTGSMHGTLPRPALDGRTLSNHKAVRAEEEGLHFLGETIVEHPKVATCFGVPHSDRSVSAAAHSKGTF